MACVYVCVYSDLCCHLETPSCSGLCSSTLDDFFWSSSSNKIYHLLFLGHIRLHGCLPCSNCCTDSVVWTAFQSVELILRWEAWGAVDGHSSTFCPPTPALSSSQRRMDSSASRNLQGKISQLRQQCWRRMSVQQIHTLFSFCCKFPREGCDV